MRTVKGRRTHRRFLAEGVRLLEEALRHDVIPRLLLISPSMVSPRGLELYEVFRSKNIPVAEISAREMNAVCDSVTSQGLLGIFDINEYPAAELSASSERTILLCENISDPGNLGTIIRCALAFGFGIILLVGNCADPFAPKVVRSSAGAIFGVGLFYAAAGEAVELVRQGKFRLIAADVGGDEKGLHKIIDPGNRVALAVGSEAEGLSETIVQAAEIRWRISHEKSVESLNAAVAAAILMKNIYDRIKGSQ